MALDKSAPNSIFRIPEDLDDRYQLYQPLPEGHFAATDALDIMSSVADQIERVIGAREPYEINLLGLRGAVSSVARPVLTIGIPRSDRLERVLPSLDLPYVVHLSSHYPASFSNVADRHPHPEHNAGLQQVLPSVGSSCGLLADDRHSVTLGSYVRLSTAPKKIYILTAPLGIQLSELVSKGSVVTQPSVADRNHLYMSEDRYWQEVLKQDPGQAAAVTARRDELEKTFELARIAGSASGQSTSTKNSPTRGNIQIDTVWGGSQPKKRSTSQSLACASDGWAVLEVTRETAIAALSPPKRRWPFGASVNGGQSTVHPLIPGLMVSKRGRTSGHTIGTVNGARSLYRLPRDGAGVRRYDYPVVSYSWGGAFGFPGDAGAVVLAHRKDEVEDKKPKDPGKPCALIVASSTGGHVSFVQDMESVVAGVKRAGLGYMSFMEIPV
ncbi:hypothetical protein JB92DRAFT_1146840 [Gautieria morchelliformis]|nr:hypothetical protein JB92DRAFT_1146840 [Gautieria morchelliformis]